MIFRKQHELPLWRTGWEVIRAFLYATPLHKKIKFFFSPQNGRGLSGYLRNVKSNTSSRVVQRQRQMRNKYKSEKEIYGTRS